MRLRVNRILMLVMVLAVAAFSIACAESPAATSPASTATPAATSTGTPAGAPSQTPTAEPATTAEPTPTAEPEQKLQVATTIYPVTYFTQRVGGDRIDVTALIAPGVEAHDFEPTPGDIQEIQAADILIYNHPAFEAWVADALEAVGGDVTAVQLADLPSDAEVEHDHNDEHDDDEHGHDDEQALDDEEAHAVEQAHDDEEAQAVEHGHDDEHGDDEHGHDDEHGDDEHGHDDHGTLDPHVWLDPIEAIEQVRRIRDALAAADPEGEAEYSGNADALVADLNNLHDQLSGSLQNCTHNTIIVSHEAYGHMAERYGIEQVGLAGIQPEFEPGPRRIAAIADQIRQLGINHILVEPMGGSQLAETVAAETGASILPLDPLESLTPDKEAAGEDYFSVMEDNIQSMVTALDCQGSQSTN
ncbi:MAG: zinc ABC transporter substrate-binding protein [Dehalococcoidia bacterium]